MSEDIVSQEIVAPLTSVAVLKVQTVEAGAERKIVSCNAKPSGVSAQSRPLVHLQPCRAQKTILCQESAAATHTLRKQTTSTATVASIHCAALADQLRKLHLPSWSLQHDSWSCDAESCLEATHPLQHLQLLRELLTQARGVEGASASCAQMGTEVSYIIVDLN